MSSRKERVVVASVVASASLTVAKLGVGLAIGSLALVSDALHSLIDFGATLMTWYAVRISARPPDAEHHYGHGKVESLAALGETGLLFLLAGGVVVEAVSRLQVGGTAVTFSVVPFAVLAIEMTVNAWRARALLRAAKETGSEALEADSLHFASDFFGSIPVVIGLGLAAYGYHWGDPAAAIAVAVLISVLAFRLGRRTIGSLVDTAPSEFTRAVEDAVGRVVGVADIERLRMRRVGADNFVDVSVAVARTLPPERLEQVKADVQKAVAGILGRADVTVSLAPRALDDESVAERVLVVARNQGLAVHHVIVHELGGRLAVSLDLELGGKLTLAEAHAIADRLEHAIEEELGPDVEVETHIEPLQIADAAGRDAPSERVAAVRAALSEFAAALGPMRNIHEVRVRETADGEVVNFHCDVDPTLTVEAVHDHVDDLERALRKRWPAIKRVIGHAEPRTGSTKP